MMRARIVQEFDFSAAGLEPVAPNEYVVAGPPRNHFSPAIPIHRNEILKVSALVRSEGSVPNKALIGLQCLDHRGEHIRVNRINRKEDSPLKLFRAYSIKDITVVEVYPDPDVLQKWQVGGGAGARICGFHIDGDTDVLLSSDKLVPYESWEIDDVERESLPTMKILFQNFPSILLAQLIPNKTVLMNYRGGAARTYCLNSTHVPLLLSEGEQGWKYLETVVTGTDQFGLGRPPYSQLRKGTAAVQMHLMANHGQKDVDSRLRIKNFKVQKIIAEQVFE